MEYLCANLLARIEHEIDGLSDHEATTRKTLQDLWKKHGTIDVSAIRDLYFRHLRSAAGPRAVSKRETRSMDQISRASPDKSRWTMQQPDHQADYGLVIGVSTRLAEVKSPLFTYGSWS